MSKKIKVGDRVEASLQGSPVQGIVKSIYVQMTKGGPSPVYKVAIDLRNGVEAEVEEVDSPAHLWNSPGEEAACTGCGEVHEQGAVSKVLQHLFAEYQTAGDDQRVEILADMGEAFLDSLKEFDLTYPEPVHDLADEVVQAQGALDNKLRKMGRVALSYIQNELRLKTVRDMMQTFAVYGGGAAGTEEPGMDMSLPPSDLLGGGGHKKGGSYN